MAADSERRFLHFPAVAPSDGVSPAALLQSLISVGGDIVSSHRSLFFPSQKRIVRELAREVEILVDFAKQALDSAAVLSDSAIVSLSEIYFAFQKIKHLVNDCGMRGARLWLIVKSDYILKEFRVLVRSISTALDVLPLSDINVSLDTKEAVALIADQAWRIDFAVDPADKKVSDAIRSILTEFEANIIPDRESMERILNYLHILHWRDCQAEVRFLDEAICNAVHSKSEFDQIALLGGLRGFVLYARCVVFDAINHRKSSKQPGRSEDTSPVGINAEEFLCPISFDVMRYPVTVSTGQTYDRTSITKWFAAGHSTCPVTSAPLPTADFVSNCTLHNLIRRHSNLRSPSTADSDAARQHFSKDLLPTIPAASAAIKALSSLLVHNLSLPAVSHKTVSETRHLSKSGPFEQAYLIEAGAVPPLLDLHFSSDPSLQETSIAAILYLSKHPAGKSAIFNYLSLAPVLHAVSQGIRPESRQNAAATIFYVASVNDYMEHIGESTDAIPALADLIKADSTRGIRIAAHTITRLLYHAPNHQAILAAVPVSHLIKLLSSEREGLVCEIFAVLSALAILPEGAKEILQCSIVRTLVGLLFTHSSTSGKEHCLSLFLSLCRAGGERVVKRIERVPSIVPTLRLVSKSSRLASYKAGSLIQILRQP